MSDASMKAQLLARLRELETQGVDGVGPRRSRGRHRLSEPVPTSAAAESPRPASSTSAPASAPESSRAASVREAAPVFLPGLDVAVLATSGATTASEETVIPPGLDLAGLGAFLADCQRCKLCQGRTQVVFGVGSATARLMFVGEGPGRDEDLQGIPFVGRAGQLLTEMIEKGMGLRRQDVYIANVVKCRPPENRNPEPDEIAACSGFLRRQVELVRPEVLVGLGRFAVQTLLATTTPISQLRGRWHDFQGTPLMATFHPAYLLRNPSEKRAAWEDLKLVMARLGLHAPKRT